MLQRQGIAFQLTLLILSSVALVFAIMLGYNYHISRALALRNARDDARELGGATLKRIEVVLYSVQKVVNGMARAVEYSLADRERLGRYLQAVVEGNPEIYGSVIAFEPYALEPGLKLFCPYYCKPGGKLTYVDLGTEAYNYPAWPWYATPKALNAPVWSEPYFDEGGGNIVLSTYSVPFYSGGKAGKKFQGVVTADLSLEWLKQMLAAMRIYQTGYAFLLSGKGTFISHPNTSLVMKETVFSVAAARKDALLDEVGHKMVKGETGFVAMQCLLNGKDSILYYAPLAVNGWSLGVMFPRDEFMADINRLNRTVLILAGAGLALLFTVILLIARSLARPMTRLTEAAEAVAEGRLADAGRVVGGMAGGGRRRTAERGEPAGAQRAPAERQARNEVCRLRQAIATMVQRLESVVAQMRQSGIQVTASGAQIDASARQLDSTVAEQAAAIQETAATSREISATTGELAQVMDQVTHSAAETTALADGGVRNLAEMQAAMQSLMQATAQISDKLGHINQKTANISRVVTTITKVATQTNLLSLNASIEADKAGAYGLGFAVVAREIRRLADQTAVAVLDIESMVTEMRAEVAAGVETVATYTGQAETSSQKIVRLGGDLRGIIEQIRQLSGQFELVNERMQAQTQGAQQINAAMEQLDETARVTRAALADFKRVAEQMNAAVRGLQTEVARFSVKT